MPNWCNNLLTIKSRNKNLLVEVRNSLSNNQDEDKGLLNYFNPMPEEIRSRNPGDPTRPKKQEFIQEYGSDNWYDWSVANWGTKWDVITCHDCQILGLDDDTWMLSIQFETAWLPPVQAIKHFVKEKRETIDSMSEDEVFWSVTLQYIEPGVGFCGVHDFLNTMESFESNYLDEDIIDNLGDYIWLEGEVQSEIEYQKEMDEEWKEESCS